MTRSRAAAPPGAVSRFAAAVLVFVGVLVGIPVVLAACAKASLGTANPLPGIGSREDIAAYFERGLTTTELVPIAVRALLVVGWLLWIAMVASAVAAIAEARSGRRSRWPQVALFSGLSRWIAAGLTVFSSWSPSFVSAAPTASRLPFTISSRPTALTAVAAPRADRPIAPGFARVLPGESAETFALRTLGDAGRWVEVWNLNRDQPVGPDGETWTAAWRLSAGWDLRVPPATDPAFLPPGDEVPAPPPSSHRVETGDSYWAIAEAGLGPGASAGAVARFTQDLIDRNAPRLGYPDPTLLRPGDVVYVGAPPPPSATVDADAAHVYVVQPGDSYWAIAERRALELHGPEGARANVVYDLMLDLIELNAPRLGHGEAEMIHPGDVLWLFDPSTVTPDLAPADAAGELALAPPAVHASSPGTSEPVPSSTAPAPSTTSTSSSTTTTSTTSTSTSTTVPALTPAGGGRDVGGESSDDPRSPLPIGIGEAALLATGLVSLLAARRRARLRAAEPPARVPLPTAGSVAAEQAMRRISDADRLLRVDIAIRAAAAKLVDTGRRIAVVRSSPAGAVELVTDKATTMSAPWVGDGRTWRLDGGIAVDELAAEARTVAMPCLALATVGVDDDGWDVLVDLEAVRLLAVEAPSDVADAVLCGVATSLASSEFAEVVHLVGVDVDERAFLGHRLAQHVATVDEAIELAGTLVGDTVAPRSTFDLRARRTGGEAWEPAVVVIGAAATGELAPSAIVDASHRRGVAFVVAGAIEGAVWTLRSSDTGWSLEGDGVWMGLRPLGIDADELGTLRDVLDVEPVVTVDFSAPATAPTAVGIPGTRQADGTMDGECESEPTLGVVDLLDAVVGEAPQGRSARAGISSAAALFVTTGNGHNGHNGHHGRLLAPTGSPPMEPPTESPWQLMVRLLGPVDVVDRGGRPAPFERAKALELAAWLVTHRDRSTRQAARTALWELDVRDATFANAVSETRRTLARHVAPPEGEEWLRRTLTDELSLHDEVVADADVIRWCLAASGGREPVDAVELLRPAIELVRAMPFEAAGYLWPDAEGTTSNLILLATSVTARYAELALALGDTDGVFWATGKGLHVLAGQETLIGLRMRAHAEAGDLSGVRSEWEAYERVINADPWSDGEPATKLVALRTHLLGK